jgi:hypothetical protein
MATLGSQRVTNTTLYLPGAGSWRADVVLEPPGVPALGKAVLSVGSLALQGWVLRADLDYDGHPHVTVVGGRGWDTLVTRPLAFQSDSGVRLSTVLNALAAAAGETIAQPPDTTIGQYYELLASRQAEPVRFVDALDDLLKSGYIKTWRVDADGVTRFVSRASAAVTARATLIARNAGLGVSTYGTDDPGTFLPGNTVDGLSIARAVVRETAGKTEVDVYISEPTATPSLREMIRRMVADAFADVARTYTVQASHDDGTLDLAPPPDATHLPELKSIEQWTMGGANVTAAVGSEVLVVFRDRRRTRPVAVAFGGTTPTKVTIKSDDMTTLGDPSAAKAVVLDGDTVTVLLPPATFSGTFFGAPVAGMLIFSTGQTVGNVQASSTKTKAQ